MTTKRGKSELRQQLRKRKESVIGATQRSLHVRPSFMFDGHEAARIEQNALHLLALSGLEQLKKLEPRFRAFESTLFAAPDSPHLDRATITKELNNRLNESIDAFLLLLSQYFLLKAAHKTIEYLIRRFSIHEYNREALMKCILPYHQTSYFVRLVQLIPLRGSERWEWLRRTKQTGAAPERSVLAAQCLRDPSLLLFICDTVKEAVEQKTSFKALFSFYLALFAEILNRSPSPEHLILDVLPYLIGGFRSTNPEYQQVSYLITSMLAMHSDHMQLSDTLVEQLLTVIIQHATPVNHFHALCCILTLLSNSSLKFGEDPHSSSNKTPAVRFSTATLTTLLKWSDLSHLLEECVKRRYDIHRFCILFVDSLVQHSVTHPQALDLLLDLLQRIPLRPYATTLTSTLLTLYTTHATTLTPSQHEKYREAFRLLDSKYPTELDVAIERRLQQRTSVKEAWMSLFEGTRHHPLTLPLLTTETITSAPSTIQSRGTNSQDNNNDEVRRDNTAKDEEKMSSSSSSSFYTTLYQELTQPHRAATSRMIALDSALALSLDTSSTIHHSAISSLLERAILSQLSEPNDSVVSHVLEIPHLVERVAARPLFVKLRELVLHPSDILRRETLCTALQLLTGPFLQKHSPTDPTLIVDTLPVLLSRIILCSANELFGTLPLQLAVEYPHPLFHALRHLFSHSNQQQQLRHLSQLLSNSTCRQAITSSDQRNSQLLTTINLQIIESLARSIAYYFDTLFPFCQQVLNSSTSDFRSVVVLELALTRTLYLLNDVGKRVRLAQLLINRLLPTFHELISHTSSSTSSSSLLLTGILPPNNNANVIHLPDGLCDWTFHEFDALFNADKSRVLAFQLWSLFSIQRSLIELHVPYGVRPQLDEILHRLYVFYTETRHSSLFRRHCKQLLVSLGSHLPVFLSKFWTEMKLADSQIVLRSTQLFEVWLRSFPTPPKHPLPLPSTSSIPPLPLPHYLVTLLVALCHPHSSVRRSVMCAIRAIQHLTGWNINSEDKHNTLFYIPFGISDVAFSKFVDALVDYTDEFVADQNFLMRFMSDFFPLAQSTSVSEEERIQILRYITFYTLYSPSLPLSAKFTLFSTLRHIPAARSSSPSLLLLHSTTSKTTTPPSDGKVLATNFNGIRFVVTVPLLRRYLTRCSSHLSNTLTPSSTSSVPSLSSATSIDRTSELHNTENGPDLSLEECRLLELLIEQFASPDVAALLDVETEHFTLLLKALTTPYQRIFTFQNDSQQQQETYTFSLQTLALNTLSSNTFVRYNLAHRQQLFNTLLTLLSDTTLASSTSVRSHCQHILQLLPLDEALIESTLRQCYDTLANEVSSSLSSSPPLKRRRRHRDAVSTENISAGVEESNQKDVNRSTADTDSVESRALRQLTALLELFQYKPNALTHTGIPALLALLRLMSDISSALHREATVEYLQQLALNALTTTTKALVVGQKKKSQRTIETNEAGGVQQTSSFHVVPESTTTTTTVSSDDDFRLVLTPTELQQLDQQYNVVDILQCLHTSSDPSIHKSALLLLATVAQLFPHKVLAHIMSVFTMVGSAAASLRSDDNYTLLVIQRTVESVVPSLLSSGLGIHQLVEAFVTQLPHIPSHRRLLLFTILVKCITPTRTLPLLLCLLLFAHLHLKSSQEGEEEATKVLELCRDVCLKCTPLETLNAFHNLFEALNTIDTLSPSFPPSLNPTLFGSQSHSAVEMLQLRIVFVQFLNSYLTARDFLAQINEISKIVTHIVKSRDNTQHRDSTRVQALLLSLFQTTLIHLHKLSQEQHVYLESSENLIDNIQHVKTSSFWTTATTATYKLIECINDLLTVPSFIEVIDTLLKHSDRRIQCRALQFFNDKLTATRDYLTEQHITLFLSTTKQLVSLVSLDEPTLETSVLRQTAAVALELLTRSFGHNPKYTNTFHALIPTLLKALTYTSGSFTTAAHVQSSIILCLSTLIRTLGSRTFDYVNQFVPSFLDVLTSTFLDQGTKESTESVSTSSAEETDARQVLQLSVLSALQVTVTELTPFLSPYLSRLLNTLLHPKLVDTERLVVGRKLPERVCRVLHALSSRVDVRLLTSPLLSTFSSVLRSGSANAMIYLADFVSDVVRHLDREQVTMHHKSLFQFFLEVLDFRYHATSDKRLRKFIPQVEEHILNALLSLIMKLNETMFKPLFLLLINWARIDTLTTTETDNSDLVLHRYIAFYTFLNALADKLKSIVVPYYTYVIDHCIRILEDPTLQNLQFFQQTKNRLERSLDHLLILVIRALHKCFTYDNEGFVNKALFDKLLHPLMSQFDKIDFGGLQRYENRIPILVECVAQLAVALNNEALWKPLNYQILLRTRSNSVSIRYAAVQQLTMLYTKLGEAYLPLLPESIQYLAELMEDSDERVERATLSLVRTLENLLGQDFRSLLQ